MALTKVIGAGLGEIPAISGANLTNLPSSGSSTTINNNADNRIITGSGTANTLEGESNLTFNGTTLAVTGNIGVSGTVDGVDIATRDTLLGGLTSSSGALSNGVTATTQSATDSTTKVATTAF